MAFHFRKHHDSKMAFLKTLATKEWHFRYPKYQKIAFLIPHTSNWHFWNPHTVNGIVETLHSTFFFSFAALIQKSRRMTSHTKKVKICPHTKNDYFETSWYQKWHIQRKYQKWGIRDPQYKRLEFLRPPYQKILRPQNIFCTPHHTKSAIKSYHTRPKFVPHTKHGQNLVKNGPKFWTPVQKRSNIWRSPIQPNKMTRHFVAPTKVQRLASVKYHYANFDPNGWPFWILR